MEQRQTRGQVCLSVLIALSAFAMAPPVRAGSPQEVLDKLCSSPDRIADLFDLTKFNPDLMRQVSAVIAGLNQKWGPCEKAVVKEKGAVEYRHPKAVVPGTLTLNGEGKIIGIWFGMPILAQDSLDEVLAAFKKLPGKAALTVRWEGKPDIASINPSTPLAVGSTFKLYVLKALKEKIDAGYLNWMDVVPLRSEFKSTPSGILQDWPVGTPMTLQTLATLMVSISDNTAADHLLFTVGRREVERLVSVRNWPFLSTLEMSQLKSKKSSEIARRYTKAKEQERRQILGELCRLKREDIEMHDSPTFVDEIEWFFSTDELCDTLLSLKDLPLLSVKTGLAKKTDSWERVAFKGGSEPGVLNMTYALQHPLTHQWVCVSATWVNPAQEVSLPQLAELLSRLFVLLQKNGK